MSGVAGLFACLVVFSWLSTEAARQRWGLRIDGLGRCPGEDRFARHRPRTGRPDDEALLMELAGALLEAGVGVERCLEVLSESSSPATAARLGRVSAALAMGTSWDGAWNAAEQHSVAASGRGRASGLRGRRYGRMRGDRHSLRGLRHHLGFAALSGAPAAGTLYAGAAAERRRRFREAERRAAALGVRLVLPLGLCSLPSFVCLGIIPVVLALLPGGL